MSIESVVPSNHLILCRPLLLLPSVFPSIRVSSSESALHIRWPKYWSFSFSISPSNEYSELISFWMDWLDLLLDLSYKCSHAAHAFLVWPSLSLLPEASFPFRTSLGLPAPAVSSPSELVSYCFCGAHSHSPSPSSSCLTRSLLDLPCLHRPL